MAVTFSFSLTSQTGKYRDVFHSSDGEEYVVNVNTNNSSTYNGYYRNEHNCSLTISWKRKFDRFIRIRKYYEGSKELLSDTKLFVKDHQLSSVSDFRIANNIVVIINIIPYVSISKCVDDKPSTEKQNLKSPKTESVVEKRLEQLSTDMKSLLQTGNLSDVILTDGKNEILAHKLVLSVRSAVFAKMFQHPMKENQENRITIKDIPIEVLRGLLNFMYTGTAVLKDMQMARDLYIAADKYDVKNLKSICSGMLKSVTLDNVLDTLLLADLYNDKILKQAALDFIANNYSQLKTLQNWGSFMKENQTLAIEILSFVLDKKV